MTQNFRSKPPFVYSSLILQFQREETPMCHIQWNLLMLWDLSFIKLQFHSFHSYFISLFALPFTLMLWDFTLVKLHFHFFQFYLISHLALLSLSLSWTPVLPQPPCSDGEVRLSPQFPRNGSGYQLNIGYEFLTGGLEICYNGSFLIVCNTTDYDPILPQTVCAQLGYPGQCVYVVYLQREIYQSCLPSILTCRLCYWSVFGECIHHPRWSH